jgi:hypothetical protein
VEGGEKCTITGDILSQIEKNAQEHIVMERKG